MNQKSAWHLARRIRGGRYGVGNRVLALIPPDSGRQAGRRPGPRGWWWVPGAGRGRHGAMLKLNHPRVDFGSETGGRGSDVKVPADVHILCL